jgi:hypothetical protein
MADQVTEIGGVPVLVCAVDGAQISGPQDALDVIGAAYDQAEVVAVPVERLDPQFFSLRSGVAGEIMQKFTNYQIRLVLVGDISGPLAESSALRDLVAEANRGRQIWFVADLEELDARLA